jgi:membrane fusion protein (multidrug efflux system)
MSTMIDDDEQTERRRGAGPGASVVTPSRPGARPAGVVRPVTGDPALEQVHETGEGSDGVVRPPSDHQPAGRRSRRPIVLGLLAVVAIIGGVIGVLYAVHASHYESTDDAFVDGHVVPISPQIPALVRSLNVDDNTPVHKGDVLVQLDPTDYQVALDQTRATVASMRGQLEQCNAQVTAAQAGVAEAQAEVDVKLSDQANMDADYKRYQELSKTQGAVSKQQLDASSAAQRSAAAQVERAKAQLAEAQSQILTAQANVIAAKGNLDKATADMHRADVNLGYCTIVAPCDGRITRKSVEPGSYVQTGQNLFAIVPADVWVVANFKETQLERMKVGQRVTITVDAYPGVSFTGHVDSFQSGTGSRFSMLPAENATGNFVHVVQRVPVKIILDGDPGQRDAEHPLTPGMSVNPEVAL